MITALHLNNFRNFSKQSFEFESEKNFIVWPNGQGKTNILEAISLLGNHAFTQIEFDNLVLDDQDFFHIECIYEDGNSVAISYDKKTKRKKYFTGKKSVNKKTFLNHTHSCCVFDPMSMNIMYLSPSLRRQFIDQAIMNAYDEYDHILKQYSKILKQRNAMLKSISQGHAQKNDITFWNTQFIELASQIYTYRETFITFLKQNISSAEIYFWNKVNKIELTYVSKINSLDSAKQEIQTYLEKNIDRDITLGKTPIGPHVDDIDILVDEKSIIQYASRWETKSVILWLKLLEAVFIEKKKNKKPIIIIDDLLSELDNDHKNLYTQKIKYYQTIISSIETVKDGKIIKI